MKKIIVFSFLILGFLTKPFAQEVQTTEDTSWQTNYRAFATKSTDLVHTKLVANFDYQKAQLNGEVWIKLRPHFYPSNSLVLDAKGMDIHQVALVVNNNNKKLAYNYDGLLLNIFLDKTYKATLCNSITEVLRLAEATSELSVSVAGFLGDHLQPETCLTASVAQLLK